MRLFLVSLLLISAAWPWNVVSLVAAEKPKCLSDGKSYMTDGTSFNIIREDKICNGVCLLRVKKDLNMRGWVISCADHGVAEKLECSPQPGGEVHCQCPTDHCFTREMGKSAYEHYDEKAELTADFFNSFVSSSARSAQGIDNGTTGGQDPQTTQGPGGESPTTEDKPQEAPVGGNPAGSQPPNNSSQGSHVFSTVSFLVFTAALVLAI